MGTHSATAHADLELAGALKAIREALSLNQSELAQSLGVSLVTVDRWSRGVGQPSILQAQQIKRLLKATAPQPAGIRGAFPSKGATRKALKSDQISLFTKILHVDRSDAPGPAVFDRLRTAGILGPDRSLPSILRHNSRPAKTPSEPVPTGASAGKNTYTYDAHTYHTKVPPQGIVEFLNHYLPQGGLVLDPFAGSGMTGVAARSTGHDVVLNELSPAACFIAHNFTQSVSPEQFAEALRLLMDSLQELRASLYTTLCRECGRPVEASYFVWSYRVACYHCGKHFTLWDHCRRYGRTVREHKILSEFACPSCGRLIQKRKLSRTHAEPVLVGYKCCSRSISEHSPSTADLERIAKIDAERPLAEGFYPTTRLPNGVNLNQPKRHGLISIDAFYTTRNLAALSHIWREIHRFTDVTLASAMAFVFTSLYQRVSRLSEYRFWGGSGNTARFNVPFIFNEANVFETFHRKAATILDHLETTATQYRGQRAVICGSATAIDFLPDQSVDLVFTDPPFGANINYSEMNILWESWLGEFTDPAYEAIINKHQGKGVEEYGQLMERSLAECHRVLRNGHWMLLVFMNSSAKVWGELKAAIRRAGFSLERADVFDKQHGTFKQFVSPNTAGCDLVIHCRKLSETDYLSDSPLHVSLRNSIQDYLAHYRHAMPTTVYLHVARQEEVDFRLLYSDWLSYALVRDHELADFADFRDIVLEVLPRGTDGQI